MTSVYFVRGVWLSGNEFGDIEGHTYKEALRDYQMMKTNAAVKSLRLIRETRSRSTVRVFKRRKRQ